MNRVTLVTVLALLIAVATQAVILAVITQQVTELKAQALLLPDKIDMLVSASDKTINLECPPCPECQDYKPDFDKLRKQLKTSNAPQGYYYYYGCK
jgi:hypothetical protein